jgi:nucleoside-diphosphate-sugar epimerase
MTRFESVFITGGAGYVGHALVPHLLAHGYRVVVYDTLWFGVRMAPHPRLRIVQGDIRNSQGIVKAATGCDAVINLACISNDTSFALDEGLSTSINRDAFVPMLQALRAAGVRRLINASTSSVYGVSDAPEVFEDHPKEPLTLYNRYKWECEQRLAEFPNPGFTWVTIRPATVCGYSPRCRFDLSVNILTNLAVNKGRITVFGGKQLRPNLNILDMVDLYRLLLELPDDRIASRTYNCGYQNLSIMRIAELVKGVVEQEFPDRPPVAIDVSPSDDPRSYHTNSSKIQRELGFVPQFTVEDAVRDLCTAFARGLLPASIEDDNYYNVKKLKALKVA